MTLVNPDPVCLHVLYAMHDLTTIKEHHMAGVCHCTYPGFSPLRLSGWAWLGGVCDHIKGFPSYIKVKTNIEVIVSLGQHLPFVTHEPPAPKFNWHIMQCCTVTLVWPARSSLLFT